METKTRPFETDKDNPEIATVAKWYLAGSELDDFSLICALAHERRLVNDLLAALTAMVDANAELAESRSLANIQQMGRASILAREVLARGIVPPFRNHQEEIDSAVAESKGCPVLGLVSRTADGMVIGMCGKPIVPGGEYCAECTSEQAAKRLSVVAGGEVRAALDMRGKLGRVRDGLTMPLSKHRTDGK